MELAAEEQRPGGSGTASPCVGGSQERVPKTSLRELLVYLVFLTDLCILTFGMVSTDMFYLNRAMSHLFVEPSAGEKGSSGFGSIESRADFWRFAEGPLLDGLYWDKWYNNRTSALHENHSYIYYENLLLGVAQIRQLKVRNSTCSIHPYFRSLLSDCYGEYRYRAEDRSDFGLKNGSEWKYTSASSLSPWFWGSVGFYSSGGYLFTLPKSKQESMEKLAFLRQNGWLTHGTRAVFIDFSTYNANVNLFCVIRLVVEFPATGGALTSSHIYSVKLLRYVTHYDYFLASCEILFCLFIVTFIIQAAIEIVKEKKEYFRSAWNWLDLLLIGVSILAIAFNIYRTAKVSLLMEELLSDPHVYPNFYFLAYWQVLYNNMNAVNVFFAWIKIFKYMSFNKIMKQLSSTLSSCVKDITGFAVMFFIVFFAYAQLGYLLFGSQVEDFSAFQNCLYVTRLKEKSLNLILAFFTPSFSQFRIILGDFEFQTTEAANRILGPIYFITFVFFVFFILLNMFLAIINESYLAVRAKLSGGFQMKDFFMQSCNKTFVKLGLKKPPVDTHPADESWDRTSTLSRREEISKPSKEDSDTEERFPTLQEFEEKHQIPPFTKDTSADTAQSYVTTAEFQRLLTYTAELVKEFNNTNAKIRKMRKTREQLKNASGKTGQ